MVADRRSAEIARLIEAIDLTWRDVEARDDRHRGADLICLREMLESLLFELA